MIFLPRMKKTTKELLEKSEDNEAGQTEFM